MSKELENIELDFTEIKNILENHVTRESTKRLLTNELSRLENLKKLLVAKEVSKSLIPSSSLLSPSEAELSSITNFAWDQSDKFVKIYLSLGDIKDPFEDNSIKLTFPDETTVKIIFGRHKFILTKLFSKVNTQESYFKRTKSKIVLYLKKKDDSNWGNIQFTKVNPVFDEKDQPDALADPSATLMTLMKKMYQDVDDDMKRVIAKSWYESQQMRDSELNLP